MTTEAKATEIAKALTIAGFNPAIVPIILAQVAHETGGFKSRVALLNNNYSGIMYLNKPTIQKNAAKGLPFPKSEGAYYYAKFATLQDWANDLKRILSRGAKPILATNTDDFVNRLKKNKYFTAPIEVYKKNISYWMQRLNKVITPKNNTLLILLFVGSLWVVFSR